MSPWDLEPIDRNSPRPTVHGAGVPLLPAEIANILYQPRREDWVPGDDRDSECERISAGLSLVMGLEKAKPFASPVDLNLYPSYASIVQYPMDLSTIKTRLDNRFYRRKKAIEFDVNYISTNAWKFHQPNSNTVHFATIITNLCLEIIRNRDAIDVPTLYQQLVANCKFLHEGADGGTKRAKAVGTSRKRSRKCNSKHTNSELKEQSEYRKSTDGVDTSKSKVNYYNFFTFMKVFLKCWIISGKKIRLAKDVGWKEQCKDLLGILNHSGDSVPFRQPVNILDEPNYRNFIDHPMDLQTVGEKLQVGNYATPTDFAKDVRLIIKNSKVYNTDKRRKIYRQTDRLSLLFEVHILNILASYKDEVRRQIL